MVLWVKALIGVTLHLYTERNATDVNFNVMAAHKLNDSPKHSANGTANNMSTVVPSKRLRASYLNQVLVRTG